MREPRRFVILDRDGTIIREYGYLNDPRKVRLLSGAVTGLRRMRAMGLGLIVITNQSGISRGFLTPERLAQINRRLCALLAARGIELDGIYICPHRADQHCACRKPKTGLLRRAAREHGFRLRDCVVIGDKDSDVGLGKNAKALAILVRTGYGAKIESDAKTMARIAPDHVVDNLARAADVIGNLFGKRKRRSGSSVRG